MSIVTKESNPELWNALFEEETNNDFAKSLQIELLEKDKEIERLNNIIKNGINEELRKELDEILKCNQKQANRIYEAIEYIKVSHTLKCTKPNVIFEITNEKLDKLLEILGDSSNDR